MKNPTSSLKNLSPHLFWDVDVNKIDFEKKKKFVIHRTLEYGILSDWKIIVEHYGIDTITNIAVSIKNLDKKSSSLISVLSGVPKEKFLCYSTKQSTPEHLNF